MSIANPIIVFPNAQFPSAASAQSNANTFQAGLWDFLRTLARAREAASGEMIPSDDPADMVDIGGGIHVPHNQIQIDSKWCDVAKHPTLAKWAIPVTPLFLLLVDVNNADATIANRAKRIRAALTSGATITRPSDGATIVNSFWTVDAATTLTRWQRLALALSTAVAFTDDWRPS